MLCMPGRSIHLPFRDLKLGLSHLPKYLRAVGGAATAEGAVSPVFVSYLYGLIVAVCVCISVRGFSSIEFNAEEAHIFVGEFHPKFVILMRGCYDC